MMLHVKWQTKTCLVALEAQEVSHRPKLQDSQQKVSALQRELEQAEAGFNKQTENLQQQLEEAKKKIFEQV